MCNCWSISLISGVLQVLRQIFTIIIITIIVIVIIIIIIIDITTTIRVFSVAGNTVTQKRVSLAPEKVEICVIVMSNTNLLREIGFRKYRYVICIPSYIHKPIISCHLTWNKCVKTENWLNPPRISHMVSLKGSKRIFDFDHV